MWLVQCARARTRTHARTRTQTRARARAHKHIPISLSLSHSVSLSVSLSLYMPFSVSVCLSVCLSLFCVHATENYNTMAMFTTRKMFGCRERKLKCRDPYSPRVLGLNGVREITTFFVVVAISAIPVGVIYPQNKSHQKKQIWYNWLLWCFETPPQPTFASFFFLSFSSFSFLKLGHETFIIIVSILQLNYIFLPAWLGSPAGMKVWTEFENFRWLCFFCQWWCFQYLNYTDRLMGTPYLFDSVQPQAWKYERRKFENSTWLGFLCQWWKVQIQSLSQDATQSAKKS